jgi:hypothetical protein
VVLFKVLIVISYNNIDIIVLFMQIPIMVGKLTIDNKELAHRVIFNKYMKTSHRILCVCVYACIRGGEILDYWFPAAKIVGTSTTTLTPIAEVVNDENAVMETVSLPVWQLVGAAGAAEGNGDVN